MSIHSQVLGLHVNLIANYIKIISVFHKSYEQISTTLILHQTSLRDQEQTVKKNEKGNNQTSENPPRGNPLFRSCLNQRREVKSQMFDYTALLWVGIGGASLALAFVQYAYSYRKRVKVAPTEAGGKEHAV
jgi:hypothetical protein